MSHLENNPYRVPSESSEPPHGFMLGVVLARAGSKGLAGKNALPCHGRPMLAWTLDHALHSEMLNDVVLSTDSPAFAEIGKSMGVGTVQRPDDLANDTATVDSAVRHAVEVYEAQHNVTVSGVVILYGNIPVRPSDLTDRAVRLLTEMQCDSVQSVCPVGKRHPYWMKKVEVEDGYQLKPYVDNSVYRRQDLPQVYALDGGLIAVTRSSLQTVQEGQPHAFLGTDRRAILTAEGDVVDVDTQIDLLFAEAVLAHRSINLKQAI